MQNGVLTMRAPITVLELFVCNFIILNEYYQNKSSVPSLMSTPLQIAFHPELQK